MRPVLIVAGPARGEVHQVDRQTFDAIDPWEPPPATSYTAELQKQYDPPELHHTTYRVHEVWKTWHIATPAESTDDPVVEFMKLAWERLVDPPA